MNSARDAWSVFPDTSRFVAKAQAERETVDTCRVKLGLPTLQTVREQAENERLRKLAATEICGYALTADKAAFVSSTDLQRYVAEALRRELSPAACNMLETAAVGGNTDYSRPPGGPDTDAPFSTVLPDRQTAFILNRNSYDAHVNLRAKPGRTSAVLAELANGLEVTVFDPARGTDGSVWCLVRTKDGQEGYVSSTLLSESCDPAGHALGYLEGPVRGSYRSAPASRDNYDTEINNSARK